MICILTYRYLQLSTLNVKKREMLAPGQQNIFCLAVIVDERVAENSCAKPPVFGLKRGQDYSERWLSPISAK